MLQALICGWALLLALGWEGLPWLLLLLIGACLAVWLGLHAALLYMRFLLSSKSKRLNWLVVVGGGLVLLGVSGWLLLQRIEFAHFLAVFLSIAPWYIFLGGVVALVFLLGPLASMQGHFLARTLYAVQSLDHSPRAWMPPGLSQLQDVFERRRTLLGALFVKALAHQGRNIFFWLRLALLGLGLICAGWVHTWAAPLALTDANFIALYATILTLAPVFEVLPNALAGEGSRFTLYMLLPVTPEGILRARVLHFLLPLLSVGTASVLLLSWEYQPGPGALLIALLAVLVMITTTVCVAVFASVWDLDMRVLVEGMEQHLLQEEGPFSPRRMLIFQLDLGLVLLQMSMLWRLPTPVALAGLVALVLVVTPLLWHFSLAQIAAHLAS